MEVQLLALASPHYHLQFVALESAHCLHPPQLLLTLRGHQHHHLRKLVPLWVNGVGLGVVGLGSGDDPQPVLGEGQALQADLFLSSSFLLQVDLTLVLVLLEVGEDDADGVLVGP